MKIIFDSEEEKENIKATITDFMCPEELGYSNSPECRIDDQDEPSRSCAECWENCGIDISVRSTEERRKGE